MKNKLKVFDKSYIESFAKEINPKVTEKQLSSVICTFNSALDDYGKNRSIITSFDYSFMNEFLTNSQTQSSTLDLFLVLESPQLELNTINLSKNRLKAWWKRFVFLWKSYFSRKNKKKKAHIVRYQEPQKYTLKDFKSEMLGYISKNISDKSTISIASKRFVLKGRDEFGITANIYPAFVTENRIKIYDDVTSKFIIIDYKNRKDNLENKFARISDKLYSAMRVFNNLYYHLMGENANQIFMESLINCCPDDLFVKSNYQTFINLVNYFNSISPANILSILDNETKLFSEKLNTVSIYKFKKFLIKINQNI